MASEDHARRGIGGVASLLLALLGCAPQQGAGPEVPPEEIAGRQAQLEALRAEVGLAPNGPPACGVDRPTAFVRRVQGSDCTDYRIEIGGYTEACVAERDDVDRLRALRPIAAAACQDACEDLRCSGSALVRQNDCAEANAYRSDECPAGEACPLLNYCTLRGTLQMPNCICSP